MGATAALEECLLWRASKSPPSGRPSARSSRRSNPSWDANFPLVLPRCQPGWNRDKTRLVVRRAQDGQANGCLGAIRWKPANGHRRLGARLTGRIESIAGKRNRQPVGARRQGGARRGVPVRVGRSADRLLATLSVRQLEGDGLVGSDGSEPSGSPMSAVRERAVLARDDEGIRVRGRFVVRVCARQSVGDRFQRRQRDRHGGVGGQPATGVGYEDRHLESVRRSEGRIGPTIRRRCWQAANRPTSGSPAARVTPQRVATLGSATGVSVRESRRHYTACLGGITAPFR